MVSERPFDTISMRDSSVMVIVSNGNVTGIIDRLVADKLVARQPSPDDRRSFLVRLTPKGATHFATIARAHETWVDELLKEFGATEAQAVIEHLDGLDVRIRTGVARQNGEARA